MQEKFWKTYTAQAEKVDSNVQTSVSSLNSMQAHY